MHFFRDSLDVELVPNTHQYTKSPAKSIFFLYFIFLLKLYEKSSILKVTLLHSSFIQTKSNPIIISTIQSSKYKEKTIQNSNFFFKKNIEIKQIKFTQAVCYGFIFNKQITQQARFASLID